MKRLLLPLLAALVLPTAVEANWLGKYNSRYDANQACGIWKLKGFNYTYTVMERRGSFQNAKPTRWKPEGVDRKYDLEYLDNFIKWRKREREKVEKTKSGFSRSCKEEKETNQYLGFEVKVKRDKVHQGYPNKIVKRRFKF